MSAVRLHTDVEGDGPPVVLAHGFAGSARNLGSQARALRDRWRVVRYDARGHARSEAPRDADAYSPEIAVEDMGRVLDTAGAEAAVVGGLSMGAQTALGFALTHPERTRGLVLAAYPAGPESGHGTSAVAGPFADAIERDGLEAAGAAFVWGERSGLDAAAARVVRQGFLEHPPYSLVHTLRRVLARQPSLDVLLPQLRALRLPALLIVGEHDQGSLEPSRRLAEAIPSARLVLVPGAGHVVNLQRPDAFNLALTSFLEGLDPT